MDIVSAALIGRLLWVLWRHGDFGGHGLKQVFGLALTAMSLNQVLVRIAPDGVPVACLFWGWISDRTIAESVQRHVLDIHPCEWNEGPHPCIMAWVGDAGARQELLAEWMARFHLPRGHRIWTFVPADRGLREFTLLPAVVGCGREVAQ